MKKVDTGTWGWEVRLGSRNGRIPPPRPFFLLLAPIYRKLAKIKGTFNKHLIHVSPSAMTMMAVATTSMMMAKDYDDQTWLR